ncbi:MAG TPA: hypothetical protein VM101_11765 [Flavitalea sp.]|nr:hypothetical protein [Flavitalea sp.]
MKNVYIVSVLAFFFFACKKDSDSAPSDPVKAANEKKAADLQVFLKANQFELTRYYSDTPIDYIDTDQVVKAETDLWDYVSPWIKDDRYSFNSDGTVTIQQNAVKIQSDSSATLSRDYSVVGDASGVTFNFIGHIYQSLNYNLIEFSDTLLKVNAKWNGNTVISEYKVAN